MSNQATTTTPKSPNLNPIAKERFRQSPQNISDHRALVESRAFDRAMDFAKLQYMTELANSTHDNNAAMANGWKVRGVEEFCGVMRTLSEHQIIQVVMPNDNLGSNRS